MITFSPFWRTRSISASAASTLVPVPQGQCIP
jgi:hypothetical protein